MLVTRPDPTGETARAAQAFVRALWGFELRISSLPPLALGLTAPPRFLGSRLWLSPNATANSPRYPLAAAAHVAAHLRFGGERFLIGGLKPLQVAIISILEDARVEWLAREQYPGLFQLWAPFFQSSPGTERTSRALLARLALSLHTGTSDADPWVSEASARFFARTSTLRDPGFVRELGGRLGNELGQMRIPFAARDGVPTPAYRDDHFGLWQLEPEHAPEGAELERAPARAAAGLEQSRRRSLSLAGMSEPPSDLAEQVRGELELPAASVLPYPEWDHLISCERPAFCGLQERAPPEGDSAPLLASLRAHAGTQRSLRRAALRLAPEQRALERRLTSGPRIDLRAAVAASLSPTAAGVPRVYRRARFRHAPAALLVLIDSSESLTSIPSGSVESALEIARRASALLASTLEGLGLDWAIHAFNSNGRHDIRYFRLKDFDEPYGELARARLAGMQASSSTRLGIALRHAGKALRARRATRKVLLVVTDGEPSDIDVHDPDYLMFDALYATRQNRSRGVVTFCIGLGAREKKRIQRMFGSRHYFLIDRVERLPEHLGRFSLRLTG